MALPHCAAPTQVRVTLDGHGKMTGMDVPWDHKVLENKLVAQDLILAAANAAHEKVSTAPTLAHPAPTAGWRCMT